MYTRLVLMIIKVFLNRITDNEYCMDRIKESNPKLGPTYKFAFPLRTAVEPYSLWVLGVLKPKGNSPSITQQYLQVRQEWLLGLQLFPVHQ